jgi:hypothetical protein
MAPCTSSFLRDFASQNTSRWNSSWRSSASASSSRTRWRCTASLAPTLTAVPMKKRSSIVQVRSYNSDTTIGIVRLHPLYRDIARCGFKQGCWFLVTLLGSDAMLSSAARLWGLCLRAGVLISTSFGRRPLLPLTTVNHCKRIFHQFPIVCSNGPPTALPDQRSRRCNPQSRQCSCDCQSYFE